MIFSSFQTGRRFIAPGIIWAAITVLPRPLSICFSQQNTFTQNSANSNYNSFQASLERKAADMTFLMAYTFSKALDDSSNFND